MANVDEILTLVNKSTGEKRTVNISQLVRDWHANAPDIGHTIGKLPQPAYDRVMTKLGYATQFHRNLVGR